MDTSNWIAVAAILAHPITGYLGYLRGKRDKRNTQKEDHDRAIFVRLNEALSYNDLDSLWTNLDRKFYFPEQGRQVSEFLQILRDPSNTFILTSLQVKAHSYSLALRTMMEFAGANCFFRDGDSERLQLHPDPWEHQKREAARRELVLLIEETENRYKEFRAEIKRQLAI